MYPLFKAYLIRPWRKKYVIGWKKKKRKGDCVICELIREGDEFVVWKGRRSAIIVNRFPYNPGHVMLVPIRHVVMLHELSQDELFELAKLMSEVPRILKDVFEPDGFNIGINIGKASGASVEHLHLHIVPRYHDDLGLLEVTVGHRMLLEAPEETCKKLRDAFKRLEI